LSLRLVDVDQMGLWITGITHPLHWAICHPRREKGTACVVPVGSWAIRYSLEMELELVAEIETWDWDSDSRMGTDDV
jgi:hypothetical protein